MSADGNTGGAGGDSGDRLVGELLVENELVTEKQRDEALEVQAEQGGRLFEVLIRLKYLNKARLHEFLSQQSGVPAIDLQNYEIPKDLMEIIPKELACEHVLLPIDKLGKLLTVGMACPLDKQAIIEVENATGLRVKAMLCEFDDIHVTLRRYYPQERVGSYEVPLPTGLASPASVPATPAVPTAPGPAVESAPAPATPAEAPPAPRDEATRKQTEALLEGIEALPSMPRTPQELAALADGPGKTVTDVAGVVGSDPAVAARVLSVANATPYGLPGEVTNINLATALLGEAGCVSVTAFCAALPAVPDSLRSQYKAFWLRSMFGAKAAMSVAREAGRGQPAEAYTTGLLHDIGRLSFLLLSEDAPPGSGENPSLMQLLREEEDLFGFSHAEAGYLLAKAWRFPSELTNVIRFHHHPYATHADDLIAATALAAFMAEAFERGDEIGPDSFDSFRELLSYLSLGSAQLVSVFKRTSQSFSGIASR
ncbi:MAG: HDOD domain-containing protein [Nitrospiraceae bacterium]|nr:HDOD domain-containing protein [Nitrospiraceae bacterium]